MRNHNTLERQKDKVIELILLGEPGREIARRFKVTENGVRSFKRRHADEIAPRVEEAVRTAADFAIANKVQRIAALNNRWTLAHQVILDRAADKTFAWAPGYTTGLLVRDVKAVGSGEGADLVDVFKVDTALLAELRAMERAAAEEMGQLPRPDPGSTTERFVLIRERIIEQGARLEPLG